MRQTDRAGVRAMAVVLALLLLTPISLSWFPVPFVWIFGGASVLAFLQMRRRGKAAVVWFNVGSCLLILAACEVALGIRDHSETKKEPQITRHQLYANLLQDPLFGYLLQPASRIRARKSQGDKTIFDVVYTVDQHGLRVSPPCSRACDRSVLFFGGSFMYGEGVNDDETLPYQVGLRTDGRYRTYNFAITGHGPQLMLALVERGKVAAVVNRAPDVALYLALYPEHVFRVSGLRDWVRSTPRYVLESDGSVVPAGRFSDHDLHPAWWRFVRNQIEKSALGSRALYFTRPIGRRDVDLFIAVVARTANLLRQTYPGIEFHVLAWGDPPMEVKSAFAQASIGLHSAGEILRANNISESDAKIALDGHPTARTQALFADYVIRSILKSDPAASRLGPR